jgi:hypothetical protein
MSARPRHRRRFPALLSGVVVGVVAGTLLFGWQGPLVAQRRIQPVTPHEMFKSGGLQSAEILREIADSLQRIEHHLISIDRSLQHRNTNPGLPPTHPNH